MEPEKASDDSDGTKIDSNGSRKRLLKLLPFLFSRLRSNPKRQKLSFRVRSESLGPQGPFLSVRQSPCPNYRRTGLGAHTLRPLQAKIADSMATAFSYAISRRRQMENGRQLSDQIADEIAASYPFQPSFMTSSRSSRPEWDGSCRRPSRAVPVPTIGTAALSNLFGKSRSS